MADGQPTGRAGRKDFFLSYAGPDRPWALWVGSVLKGAGYSVELDVWDWPVGESFVDAVNGALRRCERVVLLLSPAYFDPARYTGEEWRAAAVLNHAGGSRLFPVLVEHVDLREEAPLLADRIHVDLTGLSPHDAERELLARVGGSSGRGQAHPHPHAPAATTARFPGQLPGTWNVPARNPNFTGRDRMLQDLDELLREPRPGNPRTVVALHGTAGAGKTQLAVEYAHRCAGDHDVVWWVDARDPGRVPRQLADLAARVPALGVPAGSPPEEVCDAVLGALRGTALRWLLVLDGARHAGDVERYLPDGGSVLVTSRNPGWGALAPGPEHTVEVDALDTGDAVAFLRRRVRGIPDDVALELAEELGRLPLALEQVAAHLEETRTPPSAFLVQLRANPAAVLSKGHVVGYGGRLDTAWTSALQDVARRSPAASHLLQVIAALAPGPVPVTLFGAGAAAFSEPLRSALQDGSQEELVGVLVSSGLLRRASGALELHRPVRLVVRARTPDGAAVGREAALALAAAAPPGDPTDPTTWDDHRALVPHVLVAQHVDGEPSYRQLVLRTAEHLLAAGDARAGRLAQDALQRWSALLGPEHEDVLSARLHVAAFLDRQSDHAAARDLVRPVLARLRNVSGGDHPATLDAAHRLATELYRCGDGEEARELAGDTLRRRREVLGEDHPATLASAHLHAVLVADADRATGRELLRGVLERRRRVLGEDHPDTLRTAHSLAIHQTGRRGGVRAARLLGEDVLERRRRVLGEDHPDTLHTAHNLAVDLADLEEHAGARATAEDVLARRRRVLGADHPDTLMTANTLAGYLAALGETEAARNLLEDTLRRQQVVHGPGHDRTCGTAEDLARILWTLGERAAAQALRQEAARHRQREPAAATGGPDVPAAAPASRDHLPTGS